MAVQKYIERKLYHLSEFKKLFNAFRTENDSLELYFNSGMENPYYKICDIIFDYNNTSAFIEYNWRNKRIRCTGEFKKSEYIDDEVCILGFVHDFCYNYQIGDGYKNYESLIKHIDFSTTKAKWQEIKL